MDYKNITPISASISPMKQQAKRHYGVHPYFTRRSWHVVQVYIKNYTGKNDWVLDPFGGSGVTAIEALVLGRRAIQVDINPIANFITEQVALSPINIIKLTDSYKQVNNECRKQIEDLYNLNDTQIKEFGYVYWYPKGITLPKNADVTYVEELFTYRSLIALSILHNSIHNVADQVMRNMLLLCFSATLAKVNRTFVSAEGRAESRGGSTIFSIYRYHVPQNPVELNVWQQFEMRFKKIITAKKETNQVINGRYSDENFKTYTDSATRLSKFIPPESIDYIYTDPPYGAHISYLDLSTMWNAWLEFDVSEEQKHLEAIVGGNLNKSKKEYEDLLAISMEEMFKVLKTDRWLSVVFAHKDPSYWDVLIKSAQKSGFEYVNTAVQPVGVIWSMHKKKNPLHVLSGELVLNFRKVKNPRTIAIMSVGSDIVEIIKNSAELTIVKNLGATTEQIYEHLIPKLLELGILGEVKQKISDITPLLKQEFEFSAVDEQWHIKPNTKIGCFIPLEERIRFYVTDYLVKCKKEGKQPTFEDIIFEVMPNLINGEQPTKQSILKELEKIAHSPDGITWVISEPGSQLKLELVSDSAGLSFLPSPIKTMEHNEVIYRLAIMGIAAGLLVHIGKKEQAEIWNNEKLGKHSIKEIPPSCQLKEFAKDKIEQIDCIWFDASDNPICAFEIEGTTPITTGIDRFLELIEVAPDIGKEKRIVLVIPAKRQKMIDKILSESHYIGHPLYMETKISYLFYSSILKVYNEFVGINPKVDSLLKSLDTEKKYPNIQH